ncbi:uncharacterized protein LOC142168191 [Nicotiana tabacum]|uniref:Uncharacterized protein LOC142168191 n=1 Tax=Nicotiana tabacum TaxID=4097 RepID=A0AC58SJ24_TOBAC
MRKEIHNFSQGEGETVFEAWERFKELLRRCPHNGMEQWMKLQDFWDSLNLSSRRLLNSAVADPLMKKTPEEIVTLLNELSEDADQWSTDQGDRKTSAGVHQLESTVAMHAQIAAMAKNIKQLPLAQVQTQPQVGCDIYGMGHPSHECQATVEEVNAVGNFNRGNYQGGNNFNAMGQKYPGFSWSSPNGTLNSWQQNNPIPHGQGPPGFQNQQRQAPGTLPSDTEKNPKETIKAVSLRNGKELTNPIVKAKSKVVHKQTETPSEEKNEEQKSQNSGVQQEIEESRHMPALPFPQKMKREKLDKCFGRFLKMLKQLYVNIPFTEVLTQIPAYAKFLKEILSSKRKLEETTVVKLNAHCSAILQK